MKIRFRRFETGDRPAIEALNQRLREAGLPHVVGGESEAQAAPSAAPSPIRERMFVATDDEAIRGAVWLRELRFQSRTGVEEAGWMIYPVSESLVDARFAGVPGTLLFGLLREQPRLMALGMGGEDGPFAKLLAAARWQSRQVPFFFRIVNPTRVVRQLGIARRTRPRRILSTGLALSGAAWLGHRLLAVAGAIRAGRRPEPAELAVEDRFGGWADAIWRAHRDRYGFVAVRDAALLDALYPPSFRPLERHRARANGRDLGWVCTQTIDAQGSWLEAHFGDLRVGVIPDVFGDPADAPRLLAGATAHLISSDVDLVVTNQTHAGWCDAARRVGFWPGPSTLTFSWSPAAGKILPEMDDVHLTRSDGDGPQGEGETR